MGAFLLFMAGLARSAGSLILTRDR